MVKIEFSGLINAFISSQIADYKFEKFVEGFIVPDEDHSVPVSTNWNGESFIVQQIYYNTYTLNFKLRDFDYQNFQNIQYASKIKLLEKGKEYTAELLEFTSDQFTSEFWDITVKFKHEESRKVENPITANEYDTISIWDQTISWFSSSIHVPVLENVEFNNIVIEDVKDKITDYNIVKEYYHIRFFISTDDLKNFYTQLEKVGSFTFEAFRYQNYNYREYTVEHQPVGDGMYQMTLKLYKNNRVSIPTIDLDLLEVIIVDPDDYVKHI